jgi:DNA-3-methyladenine glycosylase II
MITSTTVRSPAPFDFGHTLAFVDGFSPMLGEQTVDGGRVTKAISIAGRAVVYRVRSDGVREHPRLNVEILSDAPLPDETQRLAVDRVARTLGAHDDLGDFYARAAADGPFEPLTRRYRGLRHVRFPSAFEAACWGVINQRIQRPAARRMKDALTALAGPSLVVDGVPYRAFPEPAALAALREDAIARHVPGRRGKAVAALSRAFTEVDESFLERSPIDAVRRWLRAVHGVGPFTSGFVLYRGLGRFDGASIVSPKLLAAAERQYARRMDREAFRRHAEGYGAWGGYWMLYLWASTFM